MFSIQLSEFSFIPIDFMLTLQSSEDVDRTEAGEEVVREGGDGGNGSN